MIRDEDFAALYCRDIGRSSVPPSLLATALLLQAHDRVNDAEAHRRATVEGSTRSRSGGASFCTKHPPAFPGATSAACADARTLSRQRGIGAGAGLLRGRALQVALDTTPILGRGAVKDTYKLLADGIRQLLRTLARVQDRELAPWAERQGYTRYLAASLKGTAEIAWDEPTAREAFLAEIVADADRLLAAARDAQDACAADSPAWGQMQALQELSLYGNQLSGAIPPDLGQLKELNTLILGHNGLVGIIPPELGQIFELNWLNLSGKSLRGCMKSQSRGLQAAQSGPDHVDKWLPNRPNSCKNP